MNALAPFNQKQLDFYNRTKTAWFNVCEGGKRGSKNVLDTYCFCRALEYHKNKIHLAAGVSIAAARLNILDCDGFGLTNYFEGRFKEGKYKDRTCLFVDTLDGQRKVILVSGGGKSGDEKLIKGNTYGMAIVTEANECHTDFIREVFDRTISSSDRKVFHDFNPKAPGHWYYKDVLEFHEESQRKNPEYGYNYGHFTIADNMSLSDEKIRKELTTYDRKSIWYMRDILGKRVAAEGIVYPMFDKGIHVAPTVPRRYTKFYISNDYGTVHPCVFLLWGLYDGVWYLVKEYYHDGSKGRQKTVDEYYADLLNFARGYKIHQFIRDQAPIAASFNIHLRRKGDFSSRDCDNEVLAGIQDVGTAFVRGLVKINDCCENTLRELDLYSWDGDSASDEVIKANDDCMDAKRYFIKTLKIAEPKRKPLA